MNIYIDISGKYSEEMKGHSVVSVDSVFYEQLREHNEINLSLLDRRITEEEYNCRYSYICNLKNRLISAYTKDIKQLFSYELSNRQAGIICGTWLSRLLFSLYDKYLLIKRISSQYSDIIVMGMRPEFSYWTSCVESTVDIVNGMSFNSMMYTYFAQKEMLDVKYFVGLEKDCVPTVYERALNLLRNPRLFQFYWYRFKARNKKRSQPPSNSRIIGNRETLLYGCRFNSSIDDYIRKHCESVDIINPEFFEKINEDIRSITEYDVEIRKKMQLDSFCPQNSFEQLILELINKLIPLDLCEGFDKAYRKANSIIKGWNYKKVYSAAKLIPGGVESFCCALLNEEKTRIIDIQHSAAYGLNEALSYEERQTYDEFLSWGWMGNNIFNSVRPVCIARFPEKKKIKKRMSDSRILYCSNVLERFECGRGQNYDLYAINHFNFYKYLKPEKAKKVVCRLFCEDYTSPIMREYLGMYKWVKIEDVNKQRFVDSACMSGIVLCDSYGSTHVESMILDRPTIFFNGLDIYVKNKQVSNILKELHECNVLARNAQEAAEIINGICDFEKWWNEPSRKVAVQKYLNLVAKDYANAGVAWAEEINRK